MCVCARLCVLTQVSEFELKLLSIDSEALDIPNQDFQAVVKMPCHAFSDVIKDMQTIGDTVQISAVKGQLKFTTYGDVGSAHVCLRYAATSTRQIRYQHGSSHPPVPTICMLGTAQPSKGPHAHHWLATQRIS